MGTARQKQTHRQREQTSGYQWGEGGAGETAVYKIDKQQGSIVQLRECGHYLVITFNGVQSVQILTHYAVHLKLT